MKKVDEGSATEREIEISKRLQSEGLLDQETLEVIKPKEAFAQAERNYLDDGGEREARGSASPPRHDRRGESRIAVHGFIHLLLSNARRRIKPPQSRMRTATRPPQRSLSRRRRGRQGMTARRFIMARPQTLIFSAIKEMRQEREVRKKLSSSLMTPPQQELTQPLHPRKLPFKPR